MSVLGFLREYYGVIGLLVLIFGFRTLLLDLRKFEYDYGPQAQLVLSGSTLYAKKNNDLVTNVRVRTTAYLQLSDERFSSENSQYIELKNYYMSSGCPIGYESMCNFDRIIQEPLRDNYIANLEILFNETPTKVYPTIVCVSSLEYSDPKALYHKQWYVSERCDPDWNFSFQRHYQVTEQEVGELISDENIIGSIEFSRSSSLGIADPLITRQILNILIQKRWKQRFVESFPLRQWRIQYFFE